MPFTRKREKKGLKEPILFNKTIQLSSEVPWNNIRQGTDMEKKQLDKTINKAYKAFWT
jgi:hypothetical protein